MPSRPLRRALLAALGLVLLAGLAVLALAPPASRRSAAVASARCAPGSTHLDPDLIARAASALRPRLGRACIAVKHPETAAELARAAGGLGERLGTNEPGAYAAALSERARIARSTPSVPGGGARWQPVGRTPLLVNDPKYPNTFGDGFVFQAGRISDYAYDPAHRRLLAAVASGGIYQSTDLGRSWRSIGDRLPSQSVGSVGYTPAGRGTVVALTGDNAFGGYTYAGVGAYYSTDDGRSWHRARGVPNGALGFKVAVDPTDARRVYLATGLGLYRSTDAGRSYRNVDLPTGRCHGDSFAKDCFLANIVTDVVVQAPDSFGHRGGAVLAAVGWRSGAFKNADGSPQAPANGLYRSEGGAPGSFQNLDENANGFARQPNVGRTELGAADGPGQNHGYVYAVVQDAVLFSRGTVEGLDVGGADGDPAGTGIDPTKTPTYLNGVYVSSDFGRTWTQMAGREQFQSPATGSTLAQLQGLGFGPGIQAWYDEWIKPDPTRQVGGVPTRLDLGLEEIYENRLTSTPQNGRSDFKAIGPYNANGGACLLVVASPACAQARSTDPSNTTTHPDQHAGVFVPDGRGGVTLAVGNDGGAYVQHTGAGQENSQRGFGPGAQDGFHTLLPYGVAVARDGVVYAGLQDNGEDRIDRAGRQNEVFGGDGIFTVVDPRNSSTVYEETPQAGIRVSTDGGVDFKEIGPQVANASFYSPLLMDPLSAKHIVSGGRQVVESTAGTDNNGNTSDAADHQAGDPEWVRVFDLGTRRHPGRAPDSDPVSGRPTIEKGDVENQVSAEAVRGAAVYAGFCGDCDPVRDHISFARGLATNVGGRGRPASLSASGWHIARAKGLPSRLITSVTVDPGDVRTIYVTLGSSSLRPYAPPGALGPDGLSTRSGSVYESTDAGASFRDISGNLPRIGAAWTVLRGRQLLVADTVGVFASTTGVSARRARAPRYAVLGRGLPAAPVFSMALKPSDPRTLFVASLGRGVYSYRFAAAGCRDRVPPSTRLVRGRLGPGGTDLSGRASDRGCQGRPGRVRRVLVSVARVTHGGRCRYLRSDGALGAPSDCRRATFLTARGTRSWRLRLPRPLPGGRYRVLLRAIDAAGNRERLRVGRSYLLLRAR